MPKIKQLVWEEPYVSEGYSLIQTTCGNYHYEIVHDADEPMLRVYWELSHPNELVGDQERIDDGDILKDDIQRAKAVAQAHFEELINQYFDEEQ